MDGQIVLWFRIVSTIVVLSLGACMDSGYVPFRVVYRVDDQYYASPQPLSGELRNNVKAVLDLYDVSYRQTNDGQILIPAALASDMELMFNYSTKAQDKDWISEHK